MQREQINLDKNELERIISESIQEFIDKNNPDMPPKRVEPKQASSPAEVPTEQPAKAPQTLVNFDDPEQPFKVMFSERGFSIEDTRLSFEEIEQALSKGYNITLSQGEGLELTPVRMQKIMKYKDLY